MILSNQKTSLLVPSQLPAFVREDPNYANFVLFLQAYYEWMEQQDGVMDLSKNLLSYKDIDELQAAQGSSSVVNQFIDYFYNDFMPYFPADILADKSKVIKIAKQLYQTKGTPASFKFLFRILYNTDVDFFFTESAVLKASAGTWYVAKSLNLNTNDPNFLLIANYRIVGESTKSIATIEATTFDGAKTEVFISNIERLFESGEYVRVVDSNNQDVLFNGNPLRAKVIGQISQVKIDPSNRGNYYQPGDPLVFIGGLNSNTGHGASAVVGTTTTGSVQRITVDNGGYGYTNYPNTIISFSDITPGGASPIAVVGTLSPSGVAVATLIPTDTIGIKKNIPLGNSNYYFSTNLSANANTSFANAFTFTSLTTYPISSILLQNGGGGLSVPPGITALSQFPVDDLSTSNLNTLGMLAPIQIVNAGTGYALGDKIVFAGGSGYGAYANVTSVNFAGAISTVGYVYPNNGQLPHPYPLGGLGYNLNSLPVVTINSVSGSNASIYVPGVLGDGAKFTSITNRIGTISTISVSDFGTDYISNPTISLKIQDIAVSNVSVSNLPSRGDIVYQGTSLSNTSYIATVDSITVLQGFSDPTQSIYNIRVYNYNNLPQYAKQLHVVSSASVSKNINLNLTNLYTSINPNARYDSTGVITYGDGSARANTTFLNGLAISSGQYLDSSGQLSSYDVLQSTIYNKYTYELTLEREISKYRNTLLDLLHPTGMQVIGRYAMKANASTNFNVFGDLKQAHTLPHYTGTNYSSGTMISDFVNTSTNIVTFNGLASANLQAIMLVGDTLQMTSTATGQKVYSEILSSHIGNTPGANTVTLRDNVWLSFANVAYVTANAGDSYINITSLTGSYNIVNNGNYKNPNIPLQDILYATDTILIANNSVQTVAGVDYNNNIVYLSGALSNSVNSLMSVSRTFFADDGKVVIFGATGEVNIPVLTDENGNTLTTEDETQIILD